MPAMSPRSILKQTSSSSSPPKPNVPSLAHALPYPPPQPQVHFPPTPSLTQTHQTYAGSTYDRTPIVVLPNDCALPERGCPGRTYDGKRADPSPGSATGCIPKSGKHPHPRIAKAGSSGRIPYCGAQSGPPPLVPDVSSESDESDGVVSPPPEYTSACGAGAANRPYTHGIKIASPSQEQLDKAFSFLNLAPSSTPNRDSEKRDKERKRHSKTPRFKPEDGARSFAASSLDGLDGCLGGF